jgi:hypothetical protein
MISRKPNAAKQVAVMAMSAALFAVFFFLSGLVALPKFTLLYLPIILLGVFPIWFGFSGLVGSAIGAFIGGALVEGLGPLGWIESVTAFIIYSLNWLLLTQTALAGKNKKNLILLIAVYAVTLFIGTCSILGEDIVFGIVSATVAEIILIPTFALNLAIQCIICPILIRILTPKLKSMGIYSGTFSEWRTHKAQKVNSVHAESKTKKNSFSNTLYTT